MGWVREVAPPPTNVEMLKRDYVADRITLEQYEEALGIMLGDGTADEVAPRDWVIAGSARGRVIRDELSMTCSPPPGTGMIGSRRDPGKEIRQ